jgi:penicillin-binding protein 1C
MKQRKIRKFIIRKRKYLITILILLFLFLLIPPVHFKDPSSTILLDRNGELLGAKVAADGQWRFPGTDRLPDKYVKAVICFEDRWFYYHPGVNPVSMIRALFQYIRHGRIVSGGSTLTMQTVRISRKNRIRNIPEKIVESVIALRTELRYSKKSILNFYASNAPFGGNVVGLEAASWRFYGKTPDQLSWAEAATLAVLPNSPSLIFPGKNQEKLVRKRNDLLKRMFLQGIFDRQTFELSLSEPVPGKPHPLPKLAPHLLERSVADGFSSQRINSTLDQSLQEHINEINDSYSEIYLYNNVGNLAILVLNTKTGEVLAYSGNSKIKGEKEGRDVDMIMAKRSYGSLLKPFLYASMLNDGLLLPEMLVSDVPVSFQGYSPKNVLKIYEGVVPANEVLARSLNVPSVIMLHNYGIGKFNAILKDLGMSTLNFPPEHYGLSIILGGAEGTLWELTSMYAALGHRIIYPDHDSLRITYIRNGSTPRSSFWLRQFAPSPVWFTLKAITSARRPEDDGTLKYFYYSRKIAWKTGTSFGSRDAWAIGVTPDYTVGIWIGNADGEGRPGLTGITYAAPVLFDVFGQLPATGWFKEPLSNMIPARICKISGCIAGPDCPETVKTLIMTGANLTKPCPYHRIVHLDPTGQFQVTDKCLSPSEMITRSWFLLPPVQEYYYRQYHSNYEPLPAFMKGCRDERSLQNPIGLIYPYPGMKIYLPLDRNEKQTHSIWKATHRDAKATIYWHLDENFLAKTYGDHSIEVSAEPGIHKLTLVDDNGESLTTTVEIIGLDKNKHP